MALLAATITAIENRWSVKYIAQLTRRSTFIKGDVTFGVRDDDVLEQSVITAQAFVKLKRGTTEEGNPLVIEMVPYFLVPPGQQDESIRAAFDLAVSMLVSPPITTATTALPKTDDDFNGRFDGDDFEDLTDIQSASRPKRGTY